MSRFLVVASPFSSPSTGAIFAHANGGDVGDGPDGGGASGSGGSTATRRSPKSGSRADAEEYAYLHANKGHGLKPDERSVTKRILWCLKNPKIGYYTDRIIASEFCDHCHFSWVSDVREVSASSGGFPPLDAQLPESLYPVELCEEWRKILDKGGTPRLSKRPSKHGITTFVQDVSEIAESNRRRAANVGHGAKLDEASIRRKIEWHLEHEKYRHFSDGQIADGCHTIQSWVTARRSNSSVQMSCPADLPECIGEYPELGVQHKHKVQWKKITDAGGLPRQPSGTHFAASRTLRVSQECCEPKFTESTAWFFVHKGVCSQ